MKSVSTIRPEAPRPSSSNGEFGTHHFHVSSGSAIQQIQAHVLYFFTLWVFNRGSWLTNLRFWVLLCAKQINKACIPQHVILFICLYLHFNLVEHLWNPFRWFARIPDGPLLQCISCQCFFFFLPPRMAATRKWVPYFLMMLSVIVCRLGRRPSCLMLRTKSGSKGTASCLSTAKLFTFHRPNSLQNVRIYFVYWIALAHQWEWIKRNTFPTEHNRAPNLITYRKKRKLPMH